MLAADQPDTVTHLRDYTENDLDAIVALENRSYPLEGPWSADDYRAELAEPGTSGLVAVAGPELVGYAFASTDGGTMEILALTVTEELRGRGIGRQLLTEVLSQARLGGARQARLDVRDTNTAAIALYQAMGFVVRERRRNHYGRGVHAQHMTLTLP